MAFGDIVLLQDKTPRGPFTRRQIQEGLSRGEFTAHDLAHTPGLKDWLPLLEVLHHLDREVVHWPRTREARALPALPNAVHVSSEIETPPTVAALDPELPPLPGKLLEPPAVRPMPPELPVDRKPAAPPALPAATREASPIVARVNAFLIDCAVLFVPVLAVFAVAYGAWYVRGPLEHRDPETARQEQALLYRELRNLVLLVANGFAWLYAAGLESSPWQGTIGKQVMGLVVTDSGGQRISFLRATGRHAAKYLSALPVFLGFMAALFNAQRLTWHDRLAGTRVVKR
jgi:uncharacterized RDD family membrane protein YckC